MTKISSSPDRHTFSKNKFIERATKSGSDMNSEEFMDIIKIFDSEIVNKTSRESDPKWIINNLEYDLRSTEWIVKKVQASNKYAQQIYAALCNNDFQKLDVIPILTNAVWSCSWRYAGGIVADMRGEGDYIDWYSSGAGGAYDELPGPVTEGTITSEVKDDLRKLGWVVKDV